MFIYTLSSIFAYTNLLSPVYFYILLLLIFLLVFFTVPDCNKLWLDPNEKSLYLILQSCWYGQAALWRAFWPFFILANIAFFYIDYRVTNVTFTISSWRTVHVILFFPGIWWLTSVWNCSTNTEKKIWSSCARSVSIYFVIDYCLRLITSYEYPYILFDCKLLMIEYGDCF